jgi:hypothetical protein
MSSFVCRHQLDFSLYEIRQIGRYIFRSDDTSFNIIVILSRIGAAVAQWIKRSACNHRVVGSGHPQKESLVVSGRASDQKMPVKVPCQGAPSAFSSEGVCDVKTNFPD